MAPRTRDTDCLVNACDPKTGGCFPKPQPAKTKCEDGDKCTVSDACNGKGGCVAGADVCECNKASDCLTKDDGDLCNGVPYCDTSVPGKHVCKPNKASVVVCPAVNDSACIKNHCDPKTGACHLAKLATGTTCDDGDLCTKSTICDDGDCSKGTYVCSCASNADCIGVDDGNLCNGVPYCDTSVPGNFKCKPNPGSAIHCPQSKNTQCLQNQCDPKTGSCGLGPFKSKKSCDDNEPCTADDVCKDGSCIGGSATSCDDKDVCTKDVCVNGKGCQNVQQNCNDGNTCSVDKCDAKTGKCDFSSQLKDGAVCNSDNDGCTLNDTCDKGVCHTGVQVKCQLSQNACDISLCQSKGPIQYQCLLGTKKDGEVCDDASSCTIGSTCKAGQCQSTGKERLWKHVAAGPSGDYNYSDVVAVGTGVVAAGGRHWHSNGKLAASYVRVVRLGADGKEILDFWEDKSPDPASVVNASGIRKLPSGKLLTTGTTKKDGAWQALVARLDPTSLKADFVRHHKVFNGIITHGMTLLSDNGAVIVGDAVDAGGSFSPLVRVSSTGHLLSASKIDSPVKNDIGHDVVAIPGGQLLVAGRTGAVGGKNHGLLIRCDLAGKVIWRRDTSLPTTTGSFLRHVRYTAGVGITVVGSQVAKSANRYFVARYDLSGLRSWHRLSPGQATPRGATLLDSGKLFVVGEAAGGAGGDAWAMLTDPAANPVWQQSYDDLGGAGVSASSVFTAATRSTNGFFAVGNIATTPRAQAVVVSLSAWGHSTCKSAGGCGGVGPDSCDDGKPCTLDLCSIKTGKCQHTSLDGLICDPQDGCTVNATCKAGACVADPNGLKWAREYSWHKGTSHWDKFAGVYRIAGTKDGGTVVFGHYRAEDKPSAQTTAKAHLRRLDHSGASLWEVERPGGDPFSYRASNGVYSWPQQVELLESQSGEIWLWGWTGTNANFGKGFIDRWDASGKYLGRVDSVVKSSSFTWGISALMQREGGDIVHFNQTAFTRRKADLSLVTHTKMTSYSGVIYHLAEGPSGQTLAVGNAGSHIWIARHAANGNREMAAQVKTTNARPLGVHIDSNGNFSIPAVYVGGGKANLQLHTIDGKTGAHLANVKLGQLDSSVFVSATTAPGGGWAWLTASANKPRINNILLTTDSGAVNYTRSVTLTQQGLLQAIASGADGQSLIFGGYDVNENGLKRTRIHKTGPWALAPCSTAGKCKAASLEDCSDNDACTLDRCDPTTGCQNKKLDCNDGNACTVDSCNKKTGCSHKAVICQDDGLACTTAVCQPIGIGARLEPKKGGVHHEYFWEKAGCNQRLNQDCIDGDPCTLNGCDAKGCTTKEPDCNDNNPCTSDGCSVKGDPYTCTHSALVCNDNEPCTIDACLKTTGCVYVAAAEGLKCEDDLVCKLGEGVCKGSKCVVTPPGAVNGCHSAQPSVSCVHTKNNSSGKLANYIGKVWLDEDGDGKNPKLETCDMKAGGVKLLYTNGTTRADAGWSGADVTRCHMPLYGGPFVQTQTRYTMFPSYNTGKPGPPQVILAKIPVPGKHNTVRVKFSIFAWGNLQWLLHTRLQIGGKVIFDDLLKNLSPVPRNNMGFGGCTPDKLWSGNYVEQVVDVQLPHTAADIDIVFSGTPTAKDTQGHVIVGDVQVWTR